jgi:hypothetical protein
LDEGLIKKEVPFHDAVLALSAPFTGEAKELFKTTMRYSGASWGNSTLALVREMSRTKQTAKLSRYNPSTGTLETLYELSTNDAYNNPGNPVTEKNKFGRQVILTTENGTKLLLNNTTGAGNFIVYKGTGTTVNVTGLANFTNYSFDVYEYNGKYMHNKFATAATSSNSTLPVKLITFAGVNKNNDALINWITASEIENKGFEVERSLDGKSFVNVGFVKGKGNSNSTNRYELTDKGVFAKNTVAYYRLKQIDFNGTYTYSQVIKINAKSTATNSMVVYPNPSVGEFNVSFQSNIEGNGLIEISDIQGKVIYTKNVLVSLGANNFPIEEKANFGKGIYFVKFNMNGEIHVEKLVKN